MPTLDTLFSPQALSAAIGAGHVTRTRDAALGLSLYAYTRSCQYDHAWNEVTTRCRGLVVSDADGTVVAWPLRKFFNTTDHTRGVDYAPPLPSGPFHIYDKVDGSLGLIFFWRGQWRAATTAAFGSPQARWAQSYLAGRDTSALVPGNTYIAEIVYPDNRVVVDYGDRQDLVLLAAHDAHGAELDLDHAAGHWKAVGSVVRRWPTMPLDQLVQLTGSDILPDGGTARGIDTEGFVVHFVNGPRVKVKYGTYKQLHRLRSGVTARSIWQHQGASLYAGHGVTELGKALDLPRAEIRKLLADGDPLRTLLNRVPDEYDPWVRSTLNDFAQRAATLRQQIDDTFRAHASLRDRGAFAQSLRTAPPAVRSGAFRRFDGLSTDLVVWRALKPQATH
ncbi:RNA ligase (plasmid) [Streptomyces sp. YIM 121038]|uniref:RNA ligase n=1 Tax=Streptomyces sp. YIM 121038 TaxID=2136401 RepID=UPI0011109E29|nr:RNA ligase [Streptomyces sp. YIM 121038]QCX82211.1 RNA ligase [Streptomyces sp. YIM 121038]